MLEILGRNGRVFGSRSATTRREQLSENKAEDGKQEKVQDLNPTKREPISQGQPFDEQQRQEKNPDGSPQQDERGKDKPAA